MRKKWSEPKMMTLALQYTSEVDFCNTTTDSALQIQFDPDAVSSSGWQDYSNCPTTS